MKNVISMINQLMNTSKSSEKIKILKTYESYNLAKEVLIFLLDGNITTGISKKKLSKSGLKCEYTNLNDLHECLEYLRKNNTGRDSDIKSIQKFLQSITDNYTREILSRLFTKSLKIGCTSNTVNKAIPGLIHSWEVQQAYPITEKNMPKNGELFYLSQKINGNNCGYLDGKLISRQGKEFTGLDHIKEDLRRIVSDEMFINGELVRKNPEHLSDDANFQLGTGIINSDDTIDKSSIKFIIYEIFPKKEFLSGKSELTYDQRKSTYLDPLKESIQSIHTNNLEIVPIFYKGTDICKIPVYLDWAIQEGYEGLMLNKDTLWLNHRNNGILKVKRFNTSDILCTGIVEGNGKYEGMLGLIECDYKGFLLGVGSGFTDEQRHYYWEHPDEIIGHIVQIKHKGETKNKQGGVSVQFPVFQIVREDGKAISYELTTK